MFAYYTEEGKRFLLNVGSRRKPTWVVDERPKAYFQPSPRQVSFHLLSTQFRLVLLETGSTQLSVVTQN